MEQISPETRTEIMRTFVEPSYVQDVKDLIAGRRCWRITGQTFETFSKVLVAAGSVLSFSSGYFGNTTLSFVAGTVSTISLAMLQFASFSYQETTKQSKKLNIMLEKINIEALPILTGQQMEPMMKEMEQASVSPVPTETSETVVSIEEPTTLTVQVPQPIATPSPIPITSHIPALLRQRNN